LATLYKGRGVVGKATKPQSSQKLKLLAEASITNHATKVKKKREIKGKNARQSREMKLQQ
jgi:hypothetical protein